MRFASLFIITWFLGVLPGVLGYDPLPLGAAFPLPALFCQSSMGKSSDISKQGLPLGNADCSSVSSFVLCSIFISFGSALPHDWIGEGICVDIIRVRMFVARWVQIFTSSLQIMKSFFHERPLLPHIASHSPVLIFLLSYPSLFRTAFLEAYIVDVWVGFIQVG